MVPQTDAAAIAALEEGVADSLGVDSRLEVRGQVGNGPVTLPNAVAACLRSYPSGTPIGDGITRASAHALGGGAHAGTTNTHAR